jgi:hypothetical protein
MSIRDLRLFTEAWILLAAARLTLVFIPFRKIAPKLGENITDQLPLARVEKAIHGQQDVRTAILRAAARSPWRTACFEQALAAKIMLKNRKIGSVIYFGVQKNQDNLLAHAWLESGGITVTGGKDLSPFSVIAGFKS